MRNTIPRFALFLAITALHRPILVNGYDTASLAQNVSSDAFVAVYSVSTRILTRFPFVIHPIRMSLRIG